MPLNEAKGLRDFRGGLTAQQKREATAALYGLQNDDSRNSSPQHMDINQLTAAEIERMRAILNAHDRQDNKTREFDLNNPPKLPYKHQEFPRMVYHHAKAKTRIVKHDAELEAALEAGFSKEPFPAVHDEDSETELDDASAAEAAAIDAQLKKRGKGSR